MMRVRAGSANGMAVNNSVDLIEIGGLQHIGRDKRAVDAGLAWTWCGPTRFVPCCDGFMGENRIRESGAAGEERD